MSNPYGGNEQYPGTEQWTNPNVGGPQQQYPPQYQTQYQYQNQPQYPQQFGAYQQPQRRGPSGWLIALIVLLVASLVGVLAYLAGTGTFTRSSEPVTSTVVETQTLPRQPQQQPAPAQEPSRNTPAKRTYTSYAADTSVTSGAFASNVFDAFVGAYKDTGRTNVTVNVYSPTTGKTYSMSCSGDATVYCSGGNNARVKIW